MSLITKSLLVGYQYTGKSWFCDFVKGKITEKHKYKETVGIAFHYINIDDIVKSGKRFLEFFKCIGRRKSKYSENKIYFWDTAGTPRFEWMAVTMMNSNCVENVIFTVRNFAHSTNPTVFGSGLNGHGVAAGEIE